MVSNQMDTRNQSRPVADVSPTLGASQPSQQVLQDMEDEKNQPVQLTNTISNPSLPARAKLPTYSHTRQPSDSSFRRVPSSSHRRTPSSSRRWSRRYSNFSKSPVVIAARMAADIKTPTPDPSHDYHNDSTSPSDASFTGGSIDYSFMSGKSGFAYAATPSAPSMAATFDMPMRTLRSGSSTPSVPPEGCFGMIGLQLKKAMGGIKRMFTSFPISISIRIKTNGERDAEKDSDISFDGEEHTYRVKNNRFGFPLYKVVHDNFNNEQEVPVQNLKALFPHNKQLVRALVEWNRHFQNPPPHWLINFVPKAYLRRGYFLAEEVCEYFLENPDGFRYRVEYEPIGHEWCLVGTIIPRPKKIRRERHPSRNWERKDN